MSLHSEFIKMLKCIGDRICKKDLYMMILLVQMMEMITVMERESILESDEAIWQLFLLLFTKGFISPRNGNLEELIDVVDEGPKGQIMEEIAKFKQKWKSELSAASNKDASKTDLHGTFISDYPSTNSDESNGSSTDDTPVSFKCMGCQKGSPIEHFQLQCCAIPYLNPNAINITDKRYLEFSMLEDSRNMAVKFSAFMNGTCMSLKRTVSVDQAVMCLLGIATFLKPAFEKIPLLSTKAEQLKRASSMEKVFHILYVYVSWFNIFPIKHLISELGTEDDRQRLAAYSGELRRYMQRRLYKNPQRIYGELDATSGAPMVIKLDSIWDNTRIQDIHMVTIDIARLLELQAHALFLCSLDDGCVKLTYSTPMFVPPIIFPLTLKQKVALATVGVIELSCGGYHFDAQDVRSSVIASGQPGDVSQHGGQSAQGTGMTPPYVAMDYSEVTGTNNHQVLLGCGNYANNSWEFCTTAIPIPAN